MSHTFRPISDEGLVALLSEQATRSSGLVRVAVDGAPCTESHLRAAALVEPLRALGRPVHLVRAETFWRDASVRLQYGHEDADAYLNWLDAAALRREVLDPAAKNHTFLPSLRDPVTNRTTRAAPQALEPNAVLIVSGELLLGLGLPFELTVHLSMSPAARARHTTPALAWTLPAFERYDAEVAPEDQADVVVRLNDPSHPAVAIN